MLKSKKSTRHENKKFHDNSPGCRKFSLALFVYLQWGLPLQARVTFESVAATAACLNVLDIRHFKLQAECGFNLEARHDVPQRFAVLELDVVEQEVHQRLTVHSDFQVTAVGECECDLKLLIQSERKSVGMRFSVAPRRAANKRP